MSRLYPHDEVVYAGLLNPVPSLAEMGTPVVRAGLIGALDLPSITLGNSGRIVKGVHLIDVRSREGFSGSPCWLHKAFVSSDKVTGNPDSYVPFVGVGSDGDLEEAP